MADSERLALIANVAASYLRNNSVGVDQIGTVVANVTRAMQQVATGTGGEGAEAAATAEKATPAVPVRRSVQGDYIVCLEDGLRVRTLKRHLGSAHGMTPQQYREKWGLPRDYPMTAPEYSERRSAMAKSLGLGRKMQEGRKAKAGARRGRKAAAKSAAA